MRNHRRLVVWQRAHAFAVDVRRAIRQFPRTGYGSLQSQLIRAAESIVFNIVEGCAAGTQLEFARFLDIAIKSTVEVEAELELARDYGVLEPQPWEKLSNEAVEIRKMTCGLRARVRTSLEPGARKTRGK
ncbi:MAG TPA: four helix bundle protein [Gemmatimonadaceae bacterium]|nr:four helix bundle protein [Gemmatimonadaceae bacterium]